jgi:outer membrane protein TolC
MAEIVNLRLARKRAARHSEALKAAENRARHGMSKAEREQAQYRREQIDRALDGAEIDSGPREDEGK